ncbi:hypothetical protein AB0M29_17030 [Streptomyces sp. NPDC051976]|uniref:hypothetical protein n=1 Tax=Streptomyces sp. NPDC051976 TaxID=3154947 RepID=UPI0034131D5E
MANTVIRTARAVRDGRAWTGTRPTGPRHPLVAAAMVLPLAALLAYIFGGLDAVVTQASSVAGLMGR